MSGETQAKLNRHYKDNGSTSKTAFIENAINFYVGYLNANNTGEFLPDAFNRRIQDGENRIASLLFKFAVEHDMMMRLAAEGFDLDEEHLRRLRGRSVRRVKETRGKLSLEQIAREADVS
jgi:hypothetical protein